METDDAPTALEMPGRSGTPPTPAHVLSSVYLHHHATVVFTLETTGRPSGNPIGLGSPRPILPARARRAPLGPPGSIQEKNND